MDASTARATLHAWVDAADDTIVIGLASLAEPFSAMIAQLVAQRLASYDQVPVENRQAPSAPGWRRIVVPSPAKENEDQPPNLTYQQTPDGAYRLVEQRRERADWLVRRGSIKRMATPEQFAEWEAQNPDPLLDNTKE